MDYDQLIADYKESGASYSPVWIWFAKLEKDSECTLCYATVTRPDSSTTCMTNHLKKKHGMFSKYNAWKQYEELSKTRQKKAHQKKCKNSEIDGPSKKTTKAVFRFNYSYSSIGEMNFF